MSTLNNAVRVLVVEDDQMILIITKDMLEAHGCEVDLAPSGKTAIEKLTTKEYDLVLMDNNLGRMKGIDIVKIFRLHEREQFSGKRTPVIAVSSDINKKTEEKFIAAGFDYCIQKPLSAKTLKEILNAFVK